VAGGLSGGCRLLQVFFCVLTCRVLSICVCVYVLVIVCFSDDMSKCVRCKKQVQWRLYDNEQERPQRYDDSTSMCEKCQFVIGLQETGYPVQEKDYLVEARAGEVRP